ncbi:MAG: DUF3179 domain-containing protein [Proteobacteria bacterium]|nr:DUF3179 domain-containing protein [Pseudomonadota bacterium]
MRYDWFKQKRTPLVLILSLGVLVAFYNVFAGSKNGFDVSNAIVPADEILSGGPPKDGIPALTNPEMLSASEASYLSPEDRVIGITLNGESRAYPISILNWHEIVNDQIKGERFAVTYCPLCGTGVAFSAKVAGELTDFGVSGLLYNSDVLLYDRNTDSLWSQIMGQSISGKLVGEKLRQIPITHTTWKDWVQKNPDTLVLSTDTGFSRDYARDPYAGYEQSRQLFFQVSNRAPDTYHPKERVVGLDIGGVYKAYPLIELEKYGKSQFTDTINGKTITVNWDSINRSVSITDSSGSEIPSIEGFWFAWFAFYPETEVFTGS